MNGTSTLALSAALCCAVAANSARAMILFEQLPTYTSGTFSDSSGSFPWQRVAENFSLGFDATVDQIGVWGAYYTNNIVSDHFTIYIFDDAGNIPGGLLYSGAAAEVMSLDTGIDAFGCDVYKTTITLDHAFDVSAGAQYWIALDNATGLGSDWSWLDALSDGVGAYSVDYGASWIGHSAGLSLRLYGVPAPSSLALLGLGGLIAGRRRR